MKKSLIALAVAGAMTAPMIAQADATLYGYLETRLFDQEDQDLDLSATKVGLGVTGLVENDIDGLETGYQMEMRFKSSESAADNGDPSTGGTEVHKANVWMEGGFGRLTAGLQNNPAERGVWSISNRVNAFFLDQTDAINNGLVYISPNMGGLELSLGFGIDGNLGDDDGAAGDQNSSGTNVGDGEDVDVTVFGASYRAMGLGLGLGYQTVEDAGNAAAADNGYDNLSLQANYKIDALTLGASYFDHDHDTDANDYDAWLVGASYALGKASVFAEYSDKDAETDANDDDMMVIGARYALGAKAMVQIEHAQFDSDGNDQTTLEYQLNF